MVSDKQRQMLAFIEKFVEDNGYPPTHEEIRVGLNISSKSLVNYHLDALQGAALLTRSPNTPRGIRLTSESDTAWVPLVTEAVGAKVPAQIAELDPQQVLELTYNLVPNGQNLYAFKVRNGSRLEALLNEGDIVIVQPQQQAKNGEMVAAWLVEQQQTTFRRYYRENGHVRLEPDNPAVETIFVKPEAVEVRGKVVAVIRQVD
jgi:repressor LexA